MPAGSAAFDLQPNRRFEFVDTAGADALDAGNYLLAVELLTEAVKLNPLNRIAWYNLGAALHAVAYAADDPHKRGLAVCEYEKAAICLRRSLTLFNTDPDTWVLLGASLAGQKKPGEALLAFDGALYLNPKIADAHHRRGCCFAALGKVADARATIDEALRLDPMHDKAGHAKWMLLGATKSGDWCRMAAKPARILPNPYEARHAVA